MDQPLLVRVVHRLGDLHEQLQAHGERRLGRRGPRLQRLAVHELHGQERPLAVGRVGRADREDLRDAGMLQPAERRRLEGEARARLRPAGARRQHLQRDLAFGLCLRRPVHDAHAATTELAEDAELADALGSGSASGVSRWRTTASWSSPSRLGVSSQCSRDSTSARNAASSPHSRRRHASARGPGQFGGGGEDAMHGLGRRRHGTGGEASSGQRAAARD